MAGVAAVATDWTLGAAFASFLTVSNKEDAEADDAVDVVVVMVARFLILLEWNTLSLLRSKDGNDVVVVSLSCSPLHSRKVAVAVFIVSCHLVALDSGSVPVLELVVSVARLESPSSALVRLDRTDLAVGCCCCCGCTWC